MSFTTTINQEGLVTSLSRLLISSIIKNQSSFQYKTTFNGITALVTICANEAKTNTEVKYSFQIDSFLPMSESSSLIRSFKKEFEDALRISFLQVTKEKIL